MAGWKGLAQTFLQLMRLPMVQVSMWTYLCGALFAPTAFNVEMFLRGYLFVFVTQTSVHLLGDYYDRLSDEYNRYSSRATGGSRVLQENATWDQYALYGGWALAAASVLIVLFVIPAHVQRVAFVTLFFGVQYSAPPLLLNHRAMGEITAAVVTNILLPIMSYMLQAGTSSLYEHGAVYNLRMLTFPAALLKVGLILVLNQADRRADWQGGKITLPVLLNDHGTAVLHAILTAAAYALPFVLTDYLSAPDVRKLVLLELTAPPGVVLSYWLLRGASYRTRIETVLAFLHAPLPVWVLELNALAERVVRGDPSDFIFPLLLTAVLMWVFMGRFVVASQRLSSGAHGTARIEVDWTSDDQRIIVCGAGLAGLTMAALLEYMGMPYIVIDKEEERDAIKGASYALWPGTVSVLKQIGVGKQFWSENSIHISNLDVVVGDRIESTINIDGVVEGSSETLVLVPRTALIFALRQLVPREKIMYGREIYKVHMEPCEGVTVHFRGLDGSASEELHGRALVGADGAVSTCRGIMFPNMNLHYRGEIYHRGEIDLGDAEKMEIKKVFGNNAAVGRMRIIHGNGLEYSAGFLTADQRLGYWFIRQYSLKTAEELNAEDMKSCRMGFTDTMRKLYDATDPSRRFVYSIRDAQTLRSFSKAAAILIGDAAHPVTSNLMEGASLTVDDALILAVYLRDFAEYADGHVEAFYQFENRRRPYIRTATAQARLSMVTSMTFRTPPEVSTLVNILPQVPRPEATKASLRKTRIPFVKDVMERLQGYAEKRPLLAA